MYINRFLVWFLDSRAVNNDIKLFQEVKNTKSFRRYTCTCYFKILVKGILGNSKYCINALNGEKLKLHSLFKIIKAIIIFINEIEIKDKRNGLTFVLTFLFLLHPFVGLRDVGKIVLTLGSLILLTKISSCFSYFNLTYCISLHWK